MKLIDYHQHVMPQEVAALMPESVPSDAIWNPKETVEQMKQNGIEGAVLSLYHPELPINDKQQWVKIARTFNEAVAVAKQKYPDTIRAFAAIPFPYIEESLTEIDYALDELKLDGVCIFPISSETQLDEEACLPILKELDKRAAVLFMHPVNADGIPVDNERYLDSILSLSRFMYYDRLKDCPNIRFIFSHTGGTVPFLGENLGMLAYLQAKKMRMLKFLWDYLIRKKLDGDVLLKSSYVDTADCSDEASFKSQDNFFDAGRLLWGSGQDPQNLEILHKHANRFQEADLGLF